MTPEQLLSFTCKVLGVTFVNVDGTDRQTLVRACVVGQPLVLQRDLANPYDRKAVRVLCQKGGQLGYLQSSTAAAVVELLERGGSAGAQVVEITGGDHADPVIGLTLKLSVVHPEDGLRERRSRWLAHREVAEDYLDYLEAALMDDHLSEEEIRTALIFANSLPKQILRATHAKVYRKALGAACRRHAIDDAAATRLKWLRAALERLGWAP